MATSNFSVAPNNATDASFRAWTLAIHNAIIALSNITAVTQTGEIDFTTVLTPSATSQKRGFRIYRFNDSPQATHPVYIRIDYGSGTTTTFPGLWVQIGQGVDGSGNLTTAVTGALQATQQIHTNKAGSASAFDSYVSGAGGRLTVQLWPLFHLVNENPIAFNIERNKDSAGSENDEAVLVDLIGGTSKFCNVYLKDGRTFSVGTIFVIPMNATYTTATQGLKIACFPVLHWSNFKSFNAATGFLIYATDDYDLNDMVSVTIYGSAKTYFPSQRGLGLTDASSGVARKLMVRND